MIPNLKEEKKFWKRGYKKVACIDEVGRGPLAGPVVAGAVVTDKGSSLLEIFKKAERKNNFPLSCIRDSKKLSPEKRKKFYNFLVSHRAIKWGIGKVSEKVIDKINILGATRLAMKKAVLDLKRKGIVVDYLILDGKIELDLKIPQKSIVKADEKVFSCAAASVLAKVKRDAMMEQYHRKYPRYGFDRHKGYGTKYHLRALQKYGPCKIHRKSFRPVKTCLFR